jgi:hypothetical protein
MGGSKWHLHSVGAHASIPQPQRQGRDLRRQPLGCRRLTRRKPGEFLIELHYRRAPARLHPAPDTARTDLHSGQPRQQPCGEIKGHPHCQQARPLLQPHARTPQALVLRSCRRHLPPPFVTSRASIPQQASLPQDLHPPGQRPTRPATSMSPPPRSIACAPNLYSAGAARTPRSQLTG